MFGKIETRLEEIRARLEAIRQTLEFIGDGVRALSEGGADGDRLSSLEGAVKAVRGEMAGNRVYVDAQLAAARASEDRERGHKNRAEAALELAKRTEGGEEVDSFEEIGRAFASVVPEGNDAESEGMYPVPESLVSSRAGAATARSLKRR